MQDLIRTAHVDRLPIVVSENNKFQLMGIPKMDSGTSLNTAHVVYELITDWGLQEKIVACCFDTTNVNTGDKGGAALILECLLERDLLQLSCRHHIYEIVLRGAYESKFGASSAPFPTMFKRFKDAWNGIDQNNFEIGVNDPYIKSALADVIPSITDFCKNELKVQSVRADYREFLQLCLVFLGDRSRHFPFQPPAGMSNARWMSKAIYCLKMYMFESQFKLTYSVKNAMKDFIIFVIRLYIKAWFTSTKAIEAPYNDMTFLKNLFEYEAIDKQISTYTVKKFCNHLWYLSSECIGFSLFDPNVSISEKAKMAKILLDEENDQIIKNNRYQIKPSQMPWFKQQNISDFFTKHAMKLFDRFNLSQNFLKKDPTLWEVDGEYLKAKSIIMNLTVVNDCAEQGVQLIENFNRHLTKDEDDLQFIMYVVSEYRKSHSCSTKKSLQ